MDYKARQRPALIRTMSLFVAASFLCQDVVWAVPDAAGAAFAPQTKFLAADPGFKVPVSAAVVEEVFFAPRKSSGPTVILIQDAHTNESGQLNIARTLESILEQTSVRYVFLEAGSGDDSLDFLRRLAPADQRRRAALPYLRKGLLQGAEYLNLVLDRDFKLWGVEDRALYDEALGVYRRVASVRARVLASLDRIDSAVRFIKDRTYSPDLKALDEARSAYRNESLPLADYQRFLLRAARTAGVPLAEYPAFEGLASALQRESAVRFDRVTEEQRRAMSALSDADRAELERALEAAGHDGRATAGNFELLAAFASLLEEKLLALQGDPADRRKLRKNYPHLAGYFAYIRAVSDVRPEAVWSDQERLEKELFGRFARTAAEKELVRADETNGIIRRLAELKATPADLTRVVSDRLDLRPDLLAGYLNRRIVDLGAGEEKTLFADGAFETAVRDMMRFYRLTFERDDAFLDNLTARMTETGQTESVLIAGGYHAPHLKERMRERGINYVSVLPRILHPTDSARYERLLLAQAPVTDAPASVARAINLLQAVEQPGQPVVRALAEDLASAAGTADQLPAVLSAAADAPSGSRMSNPFKPLTAAKIFRKSQLPAILPISPSKARFSVVVATDNPDVLKGRFYFHFGIDQQGFPTTEEWTTVEADIEPNPAEPGTHIVSAELDAFHTSGANLNYSGTFVWVPDSVAKDPALLTDFKASHPLAIWQGAHRINNVIQMRLTRETASKQGKEMLAQTLASIRGRDGRGTRELVNRRSVRALERLAIGLVRALADERQYDLRQRAKIAVILRDLFDEKGNYLRLPKEWFRMAASLMRGNRGKLIALGSNAGTDGTPVFAQHVSPDAISQSYEKLSHALRRRLLEERLVPRFSERLRASADELGALPDRVSVAGFMRFTIGHGDAADGPNRDRFDRDQWVLNVPVTLMPDYDWSADDADNAAVDRSPDLRIAVSRQPSRSGHTEISVNSSVYDVRSGKPYAKVAGQEAVYSPSLQITPQTRIEHTYAVGAVRLISELTGLSVEDIIGKGNNLHLEIDSYAPRETGLGGSVTFGVKLLEALLRSIGLDERLTPDEYEDLTVLLESRQGGLGGKQDANADRGLKLYHLEKGAESFDMRSKTQEVLGPDSRAEREFLDLIDRHGVLFLTKPHRAGDSLKELYLGAERRDPAFLAEVGRALDQSQALKDYLVEAERTGTPVTIERIAEVVNQQTESFEKVVPGYLTPEAERIIRHFGDQGLTIGGQLMGAGFGGFLMLLLKDPADRKRVEDELAVIGEELTRGYLREGIHSLRAGVYPFRTVRRTAAAGEAPRPENSGARMAEVALKGDGTTMRSAEGRAAIFQPKSAEEIVFTVPEKERAYFLEEFQNKFVRSVLEAVRQSRDPEEVPAMTLYFQTIVDTSVRDFESPASADHSQNPIAHLNRLLKKDIGSAVSDPTLGVTSEQITFLLDQSRLNSLIMSSLLGSRYQEMTEAEREAYASEQLDKAQETIWDLMLEKDALSDLIEKSVERDELIGLKLKSEIEKLRGELTLIGSQRAVNISKKVADKGSDQEAGASSGLTEESARLRKAARKIIVDIRSKERLLKKNQKVVQDNKDLGMLMFIFKNIAEREIVQAYFDTSVPASGPSKRESTIRRMAESNRSFASLMYEDILIRKIYPARRMAHQKRLAAPEKPQLIKQEELQNEMVEQLTRLLARVAQSAEEVAEAHHIKSEEGDDWILIVNQTMTADTFMDIWHRYGHRIRGIATSSATLVSHWVIVAQGLPNPPAIVLIKDDQGVAALNRVKSGDPIAIVAREAKGKAEVFLDPTPGRSDEVNRQSQIADKLRELADREKDEPTPFPILANVVPGQFGQLEDSGADGVGLVRTEVWGEEVDRIMGELIHSWGENGVITRQELRARLRGQYADLMLSPALSRKRIKFRTFDIWPDKNAAFLDLLKQRAAQKPAILGDLSGSVPVEGFDFYRTAFGRERLVDQIVALIEAHATLPEGVAKAPILEIMFPSVRDTADLDYLMNEVLPEADRVLAEDGYPYLTSSPKARSHETSQTKTRHVAKYGTMVETEEVLANIREVLGHPLVQFLSVGTNDLSAAVATAELRRIGAEVRVNRDLRQFEDVFTALRPEFLRAVDDVAKAVAEHNQGKPKRAVLEMGFCGELASTDKFLLFIRRLQLRHGIPVYTSMSKGKVVLGKKVSRLIQKSDARVDQLFSRLRSNIDQAAQKLADQLLADDPDYRTEVLGTLEGTGGEAGARLAASSAKSGRRYAASYLDYRAPSRPLSEQDRDPVTFGARYVIDPARNAPLGVPAAVQGPSAAAAPVRLPSARRSPSGISAPELPAPRFAGAEQVRRSLTAEPGLEQKLKVFGARLVTIPSISARIDAGDRIPVRLTEDGTAMLRFRQDRTGQVAIDAAGPDGTLEEILVIPHAREIARVPSSRTGTADVSMSDILMAVRELETRADRAWSGLAPDAARTASVTHRTARIDLGIFATDHAEDFRAVLPALVAEAAAASKDASGRTLYILEGPEALKLQVLDAARQDPATAALFVASMSDVPSEFREARSADLLSSSDAAALRRSGRRVVTARPMRRDAEGRVDLPAMRALLRSTLRAAEVDLDLSSESFRRFHAVIQILLGHAVEPADLLSMLDGTADASVLERLAIPPLLHVPADLLIKAMSMAARMSETSA